jgi:DICT domain-containing protein
MRAFLEEGERLYPDDAAEINGNGVAAEVRDEPLLIRAFLRARNMREPAAKSFAAIIASVRRFAA